MTDEPKTPLRRPKRARKGCKKSVDDQIAKFMAFESCNTGDFDNDIGDYQINPEMLNEKLEAGYLENRIEAYMLMKGANRDDPKSKKDAYFQEKKSGVALFNSQRCNLDDDLQGNMLSEKCDSVCSLSTRRMMDLSLAELKHEAKHSLAEPKHKPSAFSSNLDNEITVLPRRMNKSN